MKHDNETHRVCNARLKLEGGKAMCCDCSPHDHCGDDALRDPIAMSEFPEEEGWEEKFEEAWLDAGNEYPNRKERVKSVITSALARAVEEEKKAWLRGERCHTCGKEKSAVNLSGYCSQCWEKKN